MRNARFLATSCLRAVCMSASTDALGSSLRMSSSMGGAVRIVPKIGLEQDPRVETRHLPQQSLPQTSRTPARAA